MDSIENKIIFKGLYSFFDCNNSLIIYNHMPDIKKKLIDILYIIEDRPRFIFAEDYEYKDLKHFLYGYLMSIDDIASIHYNINFSKWLNTETSLIWTEYLYLVLAKEDDKKAIKILIKEFRGFVNSLT